MSIVKKRTKKHKKWESYTWIFFLEATLQSYGCVGDGEEEKLEYEYIMIFRFRHIFHNNIIFSVL